MKREIILECLKQITEDYQADKVDPNSEVRGLILNRLSIIMSNHKNDLGRWEPVLAFIADGHISSVLRKDCLRNLRRASDEELMSYFSNLNDDALVTVFEIALRRRHTVR
jgi:hypothetical protein